MNKVATLFFVVLTLLSKARAQVSPTLGQDFILPAGSEVQIKSAEAQVYKSVDATGQVQVGSYYQVNYLKYVKDLEDAEKARYNRAAEMGLLYVPVTALAGGFGSSGSVKTQKEVGLFRSSDAIDRDPQNASVRPDFSAADSKDEAARNQSILENIDQVNSQGRSSVSCSSAQKAGITPAAFYAATNCYHQNKEKFKSSKIVIVDLTKPSTQKRFFVVDASTGQVLKSEFAMHGRGVGTQAGANGTPPGFHKLDGKLFRNGRPYRLGLEMKGLESKNQNSHDRAIRLHDWGSKSNIEKGLAPPTWGCVGVPDEAMPSLQEELAGGTLMFNFTGDADQMAQQSGACHLK